MIVDGDAAQCLLAVYRILLSDVVLRFQRYDQVDLMVEENEQLHAHLRQLVDQLPDHPAEGAPRPGFGDHCAPR